MGQTKYFDIFWSSSVGTKGSEKELAKKKGEGVPMETEITLNNSRAIKNHLDGGTACGTYCKEEYIRFCWFVYATSELSPSTEAYKET